MSEETTKCPLCGEALNWHGEPYPIGEGQKWDCQVCGAFQDAEDKMLATEHQPAMMSRIRELEKAFIHDMALLVELARQKQRRISELVAALEKLAKYGDCIHQSAPFHTKYRDIYGDTICVGKMVADTAREALKR